MDKKQGSIVDLIWVRHQRSSVRLSFFSVTRVKAVALILPHPFIKGCRKSECDDSLGENLVLDDNQMASMFQGPFGSKIMCTFRSIWPGKVLLSSLARTRQVNKDWCPRSTT